MKKFSCGDVVPGCGATFSAADTDGILAQVAAHARTAHGVEEVSPELAGAVLANIG